MFDLSGKHPGRAPGNRKFVGLYRWRHHDPDLFNPRAVQLVAASGKSGRYPYRRGRCRRVGQRITQPLFGRDHVVAMVAVGLWGAFLSAPAIWILPVVFPLVMAFGGARTDLGGDRAGPDRRALGADRLARGAALDRGDCGLAFSVRVSITADGPQLCAGGQHVLWHRPAGTVAAGVRRAVRVRDLLGR